MDTLTAFSRKTIKHILKTKLEEWFDSIDDDVLRDDVKDNVIISGGAIASMLMGTKPNDYDVYFTNKNTTLNVAKYYCKKFCENNKSVDTPPIVNSEVTDRVSIMINSSGAVGENNNEQEYEYYELADNVDGTRALDYLNGIMKEIKTKNKKEPYRPVFLTQNAISLSDGIQIVIRFFGEAEEIHNNYDYIHTMNYYRYRDRDLVLKQEALESIMSKNLKYVGSLYPICSLFRMKKFLKRGWNISAGEIIKMSMQISEMDMSNIDVLKEQLTGVDVMYLLELISMLESERKEINGKPIDSIYIIQLIDKIWAE